VHELEKKYPVKQKHPKQRKLEGYKKVYAKKVRQKHKHRTHIHRGE
jgi:hypothetical protein